MITGFNSFKKNNFLKFPHLNALRSKFDLELSRSRSTKDHHLNKLGRYHILNASYQIPRSLSVWFELEKKILKGFYHLWVWRLSWSCDQDHPHPPESSYEI